MRPAAYYKGKEQTYLKHCFLERYLETVVFHIGYFHLKFVYVDCFSGPWQSVDEEFSDTSIRVALDKLNYVRSVLAARGRHVEIAALFVEKDAAAFRKLETALHQHRGAVSATAFHGAFEDRIPDLLRQVGSQFAFFFVDPKGWSGFSMEKITPILEHRPGEVMVNFMYDFVNRFINFPEASNEISLDKFFGTSAWRAIRDAGDREASSLALYREQIRSIGKYNYVTSTRILKPLYERAYFHLVYATRSAKGISEFRTIEKKTAKEQEVVRLNAQRENREQRTGQTEIRFDLGSPANTDEDERTQRELEAERRLFHLLHHGPMSFERIQPIILEIPLMSPGDLSRLLTRLDRAGRIHIRYPNGKPGPIKTGIVYLSDSAPSSGLTVQSTLF